jgi:hypothetical protein
MGKEAFFEVMEKAFAEKFSHKPEVIKGNMDAVGESWESVVRIDS